MVHHPVPAALQRRKDQRKRLRRVVFQIRRDLNKQRRKRALMMHWIDCWESFKRMRCWKGKRKLGLLKLPDLLAQQQLSPLFSSRVTELKYMVFNLKPARS